MRKNKKTGIFTQLIKNYVAFMVILIAVFFISYLYLGNRFADYTSNSLPNITFNQIIRSDYEKIDATDIIKLGGWIEIVDENGNIIHQNGEKKDTIAHYSLEDIINYNSTDKVIEFSRFTYYFLGEDGKNYYCIIKFPVEKVEVKVSIKNIPYSMGKDIYNAFARAVAFFCIMLILNIIMYSIWTSRKIIRPLERLTNGINKMIDEDYEVQLQFKAASEFENIRDSFNTMAEKLKTSEREKQIIQESKTRLLVDLSHDIKTPITSISCFSKMLSEGLVEGEEKKLRYYNTIYNKSERVTELMNNLFDYVKLDSVDFKMNIEEQDICEFMRKTLSYHYDELDDNGFDLDIRIPDEEILIGFDKVLISRAFSNFITNAIKYNYKGTRLRVEIKKSDQDVIIQIADNGIGIPIDVKESIFDAFVRGDKSRKSDGGTGLGLAIAKKIFDNHGWSIKLSSEDDEKTIFTVICKN